MATKKDLIITGIPRSGTSLFCRLLSGCRNTVVINEPDEIYDILRAARLPHGMPDYYDGLRARILAGQPIQNKSKNGILTDDTRFDDEREDFVFPVESDDFLLATKVTLPYIARLRELAAVMPHAKIVACVRDPVATIRSWTSSFDHLKNAQFIDRFIGGTRDRWITGAELARVVEIGSVSEIPRRRALWWNHLAGQILESRDLVTLVDYAELVEEPQRFLSENVVGSALQPSPDAGENFKRKEGGSKNTPLEHDEIQMIREICGSTASSLGIRMG